MEALRGCGGCNHRRTQTHRAKVYFNSQHSSWAFSLESWGSVQVYERLWWIQNHHNTLTLLQCDHVVMATMSTSMFMVCYDTGSLTVYRHKLERKYTPSASSSSSLQFLYISIYSITNVQTHKHTAKQRRKEVWTIKQKDIFRTEHLSRETKRGSGMMSYLRVTSGVTDTPICNVLRAQMLHTNQTNL